LDTDEQLHTRVAWYYFIANMTQQEIGDRLGASRVRVNRLLAACRERGLVQINIRGDLAACTALERQLLSAYGLSDAVVVPIADSGSGLRDAIGVAAASYVAERLGDNMTLGLGWGRTLRAVLRAIPNRVLEGASVVGLQGGLSHCSGINTFEIVSAFADRLGADQHFFAAPVFARNEADREMILAQQPTRETYEKGCSADMALFTVGEISDSLLVTYGIEAAEERSSLEASGVVGDVLGTFLDAQGRSVDHSLNRRSVAIAPADLHDIGSRVMAAGGSSKAVAIRAALRSGIPNVLITDESTAQGLLEPAES
jgi:DNA-binding transcriptional regulator LsrR (DeoR family)